MLLYLKIDEKIFEAPSIEFLARRKAVISNEFPNSLLAELLSLKDSILLFFLFYRFSFLGKNERANENFRNERNFSSVNRCLESGSRQLSRGIGFEWHSLLEKREMELNLERLSARISVCLLVMREIASSLHREKFYQFFTRLVRFDLIGRLDG